MYALMPNTTMVRRADGAIIPDDAANSDRREYEAWLASGNIPTSVPGPTVDELRGYAASKRFSVETGGIMSGVFGQILTDRATQSALSRTIQSIDIGIVAAPIKFKTVSGFVMLDRAALVAISMEIAAHVQSSFSVESDVVAAINAGTITTTAAIDAVAWPSNS